MGVGREELTQHQASTDDNYSLYVKAKCRQRVAKAQENESRGWLARGGGQALPGVESSLCTPQRTF